MLVMTYVKSIELLG